MKQKKHEPEITKHYVILASIEEHTRIDGRNSHSRQLGDLVELKRMGNLNEISEAFKRLQSAAKTAHL